MEGLGLLFDTVAYFLITVGALSATICRVDEKVAIPSASPWRMRSPKLAAATGPVLFIAAFPMALAGLWLPSIFAVVASLAAPWVGAALITIEYLRRRFEDRATGLTRPMRTGV